MVDGSEETGAKRKHSKIGVVSVLLGILNIFIVIYYIHLFAQWLMANPEFIKNPGTINGMRVPDPVMNKISFFLTMQLIGVFTGILGLIEKNKKRLFPIIGIVLNGLFLLVTVSKLN